MELKPSRYEVEQLVEKLAATPELFAKVAALVGEVDAEKGHTLDEAETRVIERLRALGRETLQTWLQAQAQTVTPPARARRSAKKKSTA
jgi:hypothetical protein